jgi:hypothetical protein
MVVLTGTPAAPLAGAIELTCGRVVSATELALVVKTL